ncbi:hypothetical protein AnigIFM63309_010636 [Aspergillus niger]|nr:hypothetical protein AnigIFM63309_010636 [Aspergillus niger]
MSLLKDILISPEEYNRLPYILDNADLESSNGQDIKDIISLFRKHKLPQAFKPKLVHKHYDIGDDEVMVSREIPVPTHGVVSIMGPMISQRAPTLRGLHYFVDGNGDLQAYEYTIGPAPDICRYDDFFKEFSDFIVERNLQNKLGLVIGDERNDKRIWREIEVPDKRGTIMIPDNVGLEKLGLKEDRESWYNSLWHPLRRRRIPTGNE